MCRLTIKRYDKISSKINFKDYLYLKLPTLYSAFALENRTYMDKKRWCSRQLHENRLCLNLVSILHYYYNQIKHCLQYYFFLFPIGLHCKKRRVNFPSWDGGNRRTFDLRSEFTNISKITLSKRICYVYQLEIPLVVNFTKCESANSTSLRAVLPRQGEIFSMRKYCTEK